MLVRIIGHPLIEATCCLAEGSITIQYGNSLHKTRITWGRADSDLTIVTGHNKEAFIFNKEQASIYMGLEGLTEAFNSWLGVISH